MNKLSGEQVNNETRGVYTLTSADLETINELEQERNYYVMNFDGMSSSERMRHLENILSDMFIFMGGYKFQDWLRKTKVDGFTFLYVKENISETDGDEDYLRKGYEIAFTVWKQFLKILGVALPTEFFRPKKENAGFNVQSNG